LSGAIKHGLNIGGRHPLNHKWVTMRQRCMNPKSGGYKWYGARGIKICKRWDDFAKFVEDMGPRPSPTHSLERINNDGDYKPSNCRWATPHEQLIDYRRSKLTVEDVRRIRATKIDAKVLAAEYGCSAKHIYCLRRGDTWPETTYT
jgi:hypothetical protein